MKKIYFSDSAIIPNPCWDAIFKLIFTRETPSSRGALGSLASAFVERKTQVLSVSTNEPPVSSPQDRQIRFDIACKLDDGELANLEMTLYPKRHEPARLEYHLARLYTNQDIKGKSRTFDDLKQAYQISFFAGENLYRDRNLVHHFIYYDKQHELSLGGRTKIITIELKKAEGLLGKKVREMSHEELWAFFFRYGPEAAYRGLINEIMEVEEGIAMAGEELLTVTEDERLQAWLMSAEKYDLDLQNDLTEARQDGRDEGYKEAKTEDQEQLSMKDEQIRQVQERNRQLEEEIRRLRGEKGGRAFG
jgi:predicted transposase/invertase (TIGR01784 family)